MNSEIEGTVYGKVGEGVEDSQVEYKGGQKRNPKDTDSFRHMRPRSQTDHKTKKGENGADPETLLPDADEVEAGGEAVLKGVRRRFVGGAELEGAVVFAKKVVEESTHSASIAPSVSAGRKGSMGWRGNGEGGAIITGNPTAGDGQQKKGRDKE